MNKAMLDKLKRALAESESSEAKVNALRAVIGEAESNQAQAQANEADDDDKPMTRKEVMEVLKHRAAIDQNPQVGRNIPLDTNTLQRAERFAHGYGIAPIPVQSRMRMNTKELERAGISGHELRQTVELQQEADRLYMTGAILNVSPSELDAYRGYASAMRALSGKTRAQDAYTSNEGAEWVPTQVSGIMMERITYDLVLFNLFPKVTMTTRVMSYGYQGAKPTVYHYGNYPTADSEASIGASTPGSNEGTLTAKDLVARIVFDENFDEDSVYATADLRLEDLRLVSGEALEDALLNGDSASAMDTGFTYTNHPRTAFDGLRKHVHSSMKHDASGTFTLSDMDAVRLLMGGRWAQPKNLVWVTSFKALVRMGQFTETQTIEKYGPMASVLNGEVMKVKGSPVVQSGWMPEDLNTSGVYDGATTTTTTALAVNPRGFLIGDRKMLTLKAGDILETGQRQIVSKVRLGFVKRYGSSELNVIGAAYNIT